MRNILLFASIMLFFGCKVERDVTIAGNFPADHNAVVMVAGKAVQLIVNAEKHKFKLRIKDAEAGFYDIKLQIPPLATEQVDTINRSGKTVKLSFSRTISKTIYIDPKQELSYSLILELPKGINNVDSMPSRVFNKLILRLDSKSYDSRVYEDVIAIQRRYYKLQDSRERQLSQKRDQALERKNMEAYGAINDSLVDLWKMELLPLMTREYRELMRKNLGSVITPYLISKANDLDPHFQEYQSILECLKDEAASSGYANNARSRLNSLKNVSLGQKLPEPKGIDLYGKPFRLDLKYTKYTLIEFWASWCAPCRANNPELLKIYAKYHPNGFNIIGVSIDENKSAWLEAVRKDGLIWQHVSDLQSMDTSENTGRFNIVEIPNNFLIDEEGIIVAKDVNPETLRMKLAKALE